MGLIFKIFKTIIKIGIVIFLILLISGFYVYKSAVKNVPLEQKVIEVTSKNNYVEIQDISDYLKKYVVNVEDKRFYNHNGIDFIAIVGSLISNINVGYYKYGASTITQQLAKNMYFSNEKKLTRKIAEMFVAFELEREYSKDDILEMYLNIIYFGNNYYGINEASYGYFNVSPKNLNEYQSSLLVGSPQAPSIYDLKYKNNKAMEERYNQVLKILVKNKIITKIQAEEFRKMYLAS